MKLLIEDIEPGLIIPIIESKDGSAKKYYLTGPFVEAELLNRNNRLYTFECLSNAVSKFYPKIEARRALGELNHPATPSVDPANASHVIESLKWDGNQCIGRARVMTDMPRGGIVKALMDNNISLGMSSRGLGSVAVNKAGINEVQKDYVINTVDIVSDPSGINCWVNGVMENAEWIYEASSDSWKMAEKIKESIKRGPSPNAAKQASLFEAFLNSLK